MKNNHSMRCRQCWASVASILLILTISSQTALASAPGKPEALRYTTHSSKAAELFWSRSDTSGLTYEITRNGVLQETTNGTSYYDNNLSSGKNYFYEIVAIDQKGGRSAASTLFLGTPGPFTPQVPSVAAPAGLRSTVYSPTTAELFWNRPVTAGLTYLIKRDGVELNTTRGVSYFDSSLIGGKTYAYQIIAIDRQGGQSPPAQVKLVTPTRALSLPPTEPGNNNTDLALTEPDGLYDSDGYETVNVVRLDVRTATTPGVCTPSDLSGCTLADVLADTNPNDDFKVDIPIHFQGADLPDDGSVSNAEFRQRGGFTRLAPQKSFRIKLDSKENLWRGERRLQLNKMPYDQSRIRNKLAFDLMSEIPQLPSLRTQFVNLWVDDGQGPVDYGLFTHTEFIGKEYLQKRNKNTDDHIYKIEEFVFSLNDLNYLALDDDGEPIDEDRFETRLSIESGDDHHKLIDMLKAVNDKSQSFDSVLSRYFDLDNLVTWITVNFLLQQLDAVTHNFYLYNPTGSDKFYILPWDYDGTFGVEQKPANNLDKEELIRRLYYGFAKGRASNFLDRLYRQPGIYKLIVAKAADLRKNYLTDSNISERAARYSTVISPYASRSPDLNNNTSYHASNSRDFASYVARSYSALLDYNIPMPPRLSLSSKSNADNIVFKWILAYDMKGNGITYDLEISSSPAFAPNDRLLLETGLPEPGSAGFSIETSRLLPGKLFARLIARSTNMPAINWQIASNRPVIDGEMRVGVLEFDVP